MTTRLRTARSSPTGLASATLALVGVLGGLSAAVSGSTPEERGLEIAREVDHRDTGWNDQTADVRMVLRNRHGDQSARELRIRLLEVEDDGDKLLLIFDRPRDVKGTALLTYTHRAEPDDQWLFLPALKRVKRIASNNKSGSFVGSEFAYEDLASQEVDKYTYRYLRDDSTDGRSMLVVERTPKDEKSGYTRHVVWYDQQEHRPERVEFYDRKNTLLKTLTYQGYQRYLGQYWRADEMVMENHQTGKSTTLLWADYEFQAGLSDRDFDQNSLKRAR